MSLQIVDTRRVGPQSRHYGSAGGAAHRLLAVGPGEGQPAGGEPVDVGRFDERMPVATQGRTQVVHRDEQDVQLGPVILLGAEQSRGVRSGPGSQSAQLGRAKPFAQQFSSGIGTHQRNPRSHKAAGML